MNSRERVLSVLNHRKPDKIPSYEGTIDNLEICEKYNVKYAYKGITSKFIQVLIRRHKKKAAKIGLKRIFKLYHKIGIDLFCVPLSGLIPVKEIKGGFVDEMGREFKIYKDKTYNIETIYYTKGHFKTFEDYLSFPKLDPDDSIKKYIFKISKKLEKKYDVCAGFLLLGMFESVWQSFGLEGFVRLNENEKKTIISDRGDYLLQMIKKIGKWNNNEQGIIFISDDYGHKNGLFMKREYYHKLKILKYIQLACDYAHQHNLKVIMHSCGDISEILDDLISCGIDALHPIEPTTANSDYDIFKINKKYKNLVLIGNISPQDLADKTYKYVYGNTYKLLRVLGDKNFILSSGHSINPAVKIYNFESMREALRDYNKKKQINYFKD